MKLQQPLFYSRILKQNELTKGILYKMKNLLTIVFLCFCFNTFAQLKIVADSSHFFVSTNTNTLVIDDCWCFEKADNEEKITHLEPITYPLPVKHNGRWKFMNEDAQLLRRGSFDHPTLLTDKGLVRLENFEWINNHWTVKDTAFLHILDSAGQIKGTYRVVDVYKGTFLASSDNYFWGLLDSKMNTLVDFKYTSSHYQGENFRFNEKGYVTLRENKADGLNGVVDYKGNVILPFKWKLLSYVINDEDHIYAMNEYKKRGYIDIHGRTVLPFIYEHIPRELSDSNLVKTKDYTYFLDKGLNQIGPKYQAFNKEGNVYFFKRNGKWGVMDRNFEIIIPNKYSSIMDGPRLKDNPDFKSYIVVENGKYGLTTLKGENIIKPNYDCLCGLSYYAPADYYIEFKKDEVSYKFDHKGELIKKGGKSDAVCFCE